MSTISKPPSVSPRELELASLALELGATNVGGTLSPDESRLAEQARATGAAPAFVTKDVESSIRRLDDPLGAALCRMRPAVERRRVGAFYTPTRLIKPMIEWVLAREPDRVVDAGCGSGRFAAAAVCRQPDIEVLAVDLDPLATLLTRASLAVLGARAATVVQADYTTFDIPKIRGRTAYLANPPYVRHHDIDPSAKTWAVNAARRAGQKVSGLAGLHSYFFLATVLSAQPGDVGCFITSSEWLDVNYGSLIRGLFLDGLGGQSLHVLDPRAVPFEGAMTTAAIACFEVASRAPEIRLQLVSTSAELEHFEDGRLVPRGDLARTKRWSPLLLQRLTTQELGATVPLGAVAHVHRGAVTGGNEFFLLTRPKARALGIERWCRPAIVSAEEILTSDGVVRNSLDRKLLLDIPRGIDRSKYPELDAYLRTGETARDGKPPICERYIARHRRPWWYLGLKTAPPIVATYMARQAPAFARNPDGLALVNVAHGIYPHHTLTEDQLAALVTALNVSRSSFRGNGRTYHGGLEKFEPREMEALPIPADVLRP